MMTIRGIILHPSCIIYTFEEDHIQLNGFGWERAVDLGAQLFLLELSTQMLTSLGILGRFGAFWGFIPITVYNNIGLSC